jgi:SAM-dependent methyltransferase
LEAKEQFLRERRAHWNAIFKARSGASTLGRFYRGYLLHIYRFLVPPSGRILELGCGNADLLAALRPSFGVGVDFSPQAVETARQRYPHLTLSCSEVTEFDITGQFDVIILSDLVNDLWDVQELLSRMRRWCHPRTRIILNSFSRVWQLPVAVARQLNLATPMLEQNWLTVQDLRNLLELEGYDVIATRGELLFPFDLPILGNIGNRYLARIFPFNHLALTNFIIARPTACGLRPDSSVSVVIPARNEKGNIEQIFTRMPSMGAGVELIFVEGGSTDGTYDEIERQIARHPETSAVLTRQTGQGKGDAVRLGFSRASGDVLMILDADLTVSPEELPRFFTVLRDGRAEFVNGVRLVYPQQQRAMRFWNFLGNKFFSLAFSWLLGRPVKDTLCGTKVLTRGDYERIAANRSYFGEFDPFGDFDLIFGASKLSLKIADLPVHYRERTYGQTNISRWKHGWLLLRMFAFALRRIKFI